MKHALETTRAANFAEWYQEVIYAAEMAEHSSSPGCMIIKPWGYAIWERIQFLLDTRIKETGHQNCYFPLFIPMELMQREAAHVEGFAKEMAVVTHHRLVNKDGVLVPDGKLESPLIVRPTSETVIGEAMAKWVKSYRDLPLKLNQWCNIVRWELRPRMFLRTREFLWQEGHTAHATQEEALQETYQMLGVYREVVEGAMRIPVIPGEKSPDERFAGADQTHTIEAMMQDGKALQAGTSHYLGQNFAKAAEIRFQDKEGGLKFVHTTSWGVSTRLIGGLIMTHSDDDGLRLPPRIAPYQVVIVPIIREEAQRAEVMAKVEEVAARLKTLTFAGEKLRCHVDARDEQSANKKWSWIKKGVPLICEIGPRDVASNSLACIRRDRIDQKSQILPADEFAGKVDALLEEIDQAYYQQSCAYRDEKITDAPKTFADLEAYFGQEESGFVKGKWSGDPTIPEKLKTLGVTIRCIPHEQSGSAGTCVVTGAEATQDAIYAKAY
jgi:prolyl-tRNA synthetase